MKGILKNSAGHYFKDNIEEVLRQAALCFPMMKVLADLTGAFAKAFEERKRSRNMIDFSDMEQYALRILTEKEGDGWKPSAAAREYQEMFREVMIDEYQDSNLIQEAILTSVSGISRGRYNVFMVGDVKQSIYRFRLSRLSFSWRNSIRTVFMKGRGPTARSRGLTFTAISEAEKKCWRE